MKISTVLGLFFASAVLPAATHVVCNSTSDTLHDQTACAYTSVQDAITAASAGDTIVLKAGQSFAKFSIPNGKRGLVIKSSRIDEWPRGYRIMRTDPSDGSKPSPYHARVGADANSSGITVGETWLHYSGTRGSAILTGTQNSGYEIGDKIDVTGSYITPYYCREAIASKYTAGRCTSANFEKWMALYDLKVVDGDVLTVYGGLDLSTTGLNAKQAYYVRDFVFSGGFSSFNLSETPGGPPITPSPEYVPLTGLLLEHSSYPLPNHTTMYVVAKSNSAPWTLQLSTTPGGQAWTWPQLPLTYNGSTNTLGVQLWRMTPPKDIVIDGLEVTSTGATDAYSLIWIYPGTEKDDAPSGIKIRRCWIHGYDDQQSYPVVGVYMSSEDGEVSDSIIEHIYSRDQDSQAVAIANSPGSVLIENNYLSATGMSILSGGSFPNYMGRVREHMTLRRNHATKPRKWFTSIQTSRVSDTEYKVGSAYNPSTTCAAVAAHADLNQRCFYHFGNANETRHEVRISGNITYTGGSGNGFGYLYGLGDGQLYFRHNMQTGTFSCPPEINCEYAGNPVIPDGAPRLGKMIITNGVISASASFSEARLPYTKNLFESKEGNKWMVEGNVMENAFISLPGGGGIQQSMCINSTVAPNGSGTGAANYLVTSKEWTIRNNICRHAGEGFLFIGRSYSDRAEISDLGESGTALIENNLLYDIGSKRNTNTSIGSALRGQHVLNLRFQHNTVIDSIQTTMFNPRTLCCGARFVNIEANVFVPWQGTDQTGGVTALPGHAGDSHNNWMSAMSPSINAVEGSTSRMGRNILMNRNSYPFVSNRGTHYPDAPDTTYCVQANDACRLDLTLFANFLERNYSESNYRIVKPYSTYPTYTGRLIGADIDELESVIGKDGADVVSGSPPFYERSNRVVEPGLTSAVLSYRPLSTSPCVISIWSSNTYQTGIVMDSINDSSAEVLDGRRVIPINGLTGGTTYYGKRWCDTHVDVFQFTTLPEPSATTLDLFAPDRAVDVVIEWGTSVNLGNATQPVPCLASSTCSVGVPSSATHYRHAFRDSNGSVVAVSDVKTKAAQ